MPRGSAPGERRGGRQKGTPNKTTARARGLVLEFLEARTSDEITKLWESTKAESAKDAFRMWLQAQEFVLPKLAKSEIEASGPGGGPLVVEVVTYADRKDGT